LRAACSATHRADRGDRRRRQRLAKCGHPSEVWSSGCCRSSAPIRDSPERSPNAKRWAH
jgi:hypothetical protein